jgi:hypothetical protein
MISEASTFRGECHAPALPIIETTALELDEEALFQPPANTNGLVQLSAACAREHDRTIPLVSTLRRIT